MRSINKWKHTTLYNGLCCSSEVCSLLIPRVDTVCPKDFNTLHCPSVILHPSHDAGQHGQLHTILVHTAMWLFIAIWSQWGSLPDINRNLASQPIQCQNGKWRGDFLIPEPICLEKMSECMNNNNYKLSIPVAFFPPLQIIIKVPSKSGRGSAEARLIMACQTLNDTCPHRLTTFQVKWAKQ